MLKKFLLTSFLLFSSFIIIYPSKKENTKLLDYCYSFEKILAKNSLEKNSEESNNFKGFAKDVTFFGINKTSRHRSYGITVLYCIIWKLFSFERVFFNI